MPSSIYLIAYISVALFGLYYLVSGIFIHREQKRINKLNENVDNLLNSAYGYDIMDSDNMGFSHPMPKQDRTIHDVSKNRLVWDSTTKSWAKIKY